jgi:hypothetical protein
VGTEGQGLSILRNDGLNFKLSEIGFYSFHLKFLSIVNIVKQTKRYSVSIINERLECIIYWTTNWVLIVVELALNKIRLKYQIEE